MVASCWAPGCTNRLKKGSNEIRFVRFPLTNYKRLTKWLEAIKRMCAPGQTTIRPDGYLEPTEHSRLCSAHFVSGSPSVHYVDIDYCPTIFNQTSRKTKFHETLHIKQERRRSSPNNEGQKNCLKLEFEAANILMSFAETKPKEEIKDHTKTETGIHTQTDALERVHMGTQTEETCINNTSTSQNSRTRDSYSYTTPFIELITGHESSESWPNDDIMQCGVLLSTLSQWVRQKEHSDENLKMEPMEFDQIDISVQNESTKREGTQDLSKSVKRRRSSLASTRRSITGNVVSYDTGTDTSSPSSSQASAVSSSSADGIATDQPVNGLLPNPANIRMEEFLGKFDNKVKELDDEYENWKKALKGWEERESHTKSLLSESTTPILDADIPDVIKSLAEKEFICCQMMDFADAEQHVEQGLLRLYFNMNRCMQGVHLFRETVRGIKCSNQLLRDELSSAETAQMHESGLTEDHIRKSQSDAKSCIEYLLTNE